MRNRKNPISPVGTSPRGRGTFFSDIYEVSADGRERLLDRRNYLKQQPATSFRTQMKNRWQLKLDRQAQTVGTRHHDIHVTYIEEPRIPAHEIVDWRFDVYELTPEGFRTIP